MKKFYVVLIILAVAIIVGAVYFFSVVNARVQSNKEIKADYDLSATEFINQCLSDTATVKKTYNNKVVRLTGKISGIDIDTSNHSQDVTVYFSENNFTLQCRFEPKEFSQASKLKKGEGISLKGNFSSINEDIDPLALFNRCVLDKKPE
jgi:hypothetical protein